MYEIDNTDLAIIELLMEDGRMPAAEISRRVGGISQRVVRYRIARMTAAGVIKVSAIANPKQFGYSIVADIVIEVETSYISEVARSLMEYECVSYLACSIGETDVSVQVVGKNTEEIYQFSTEVIGKLKGVRKTATSIVPIVMKDVYQWRIPRGKEELDEGP